MITGTISLLDSYDVLVNSKRYKGKEHRNEIIKSWEHSYALNAKDCSISIKPDPKKEIDISGFVCVFFEDIYESKFYTSKENRDKIIKEFTEQKKLKKYFLEIIPNV
jgi:hypothetical protein